MELSSNKIYQKIDLSIIIPMYNVEDYILETLNSMRSILNENVELLLVDDGSTDSTLDLVKDWLQRNIADYILISQKNAGLSAARNIGIKKARGDLIAFFDSDDIAISNIYKDIIQTMKMNDVDFTYVRGTCFNHAVQNIYGFPDYYVWDAIMGHESLKILTAAQEPRIARLEPNACVKILKREFLLSNNLFFPEGYYFEDAFFHAECIFKSKKIALLNKTLLLYRTNRDGQITSSFGKKRSDILHVLFLVIDKYDQISMPDEVWANLIGLFVRMTVWCSENCEYEDKKDFVRNSIKLFGKIPRKIFILYAKEYSYNKSEYNLCKAYAQKNIQTLCIASEGGYPNFEGLPEPVNPNIQDIDIYSVYDKLEQLISQQKEGWAHDRFNVLNDKIELLISQQKEGWAHDRFNVLNRKIELLMAKPQKRKGGGLLNWIKRKTKHIVSNKSSV